MPVTKFLSNVRSLAAAAGRRTSFRGVPRGPRIGAAAAIAAAVTAAPSFGGGSHLAHEPLLIDLRAPSFDVVLDALVRPDGALVSALAHEIGVVSEGSNAPVVVVRLVDLPTDFDLLSPTHAARVAAAAGDADAQAWYEPRVAALLGAMVAEARSAGAGTLALMDLPLEPTAGADVGSTNDRYADLIESLDVLVSPRSLIVSQGRDASDILRRVAPNALELAGARPVLYRANRTWRVMTNEPGVSILDEWPHLVLAADTDADDLEEHPISTSGAGAGSRPAGAPGDVFLPSGGDAGSGARDTDAGSTSGSGSVSGGGGGGAGGGGAGGSSGGGSGGGSSSGGGGGLGGGGGSASVAFGAGGSDSITVGSEVVVVADRDADTDETGADDDATGSGSDASDGSKELMIFHWTVDGTVRSAAEQLGVEIVWTITEGTVDPTGSGSVDLDLLEDHVEAALPSDFAGYVMLDLETPYVEWLREGPEGANFAQAQQQLVNAVQLGKQLRPQAKWSVYMVPVLPVWLVDDDGLAYRWANAPEALREEYLARASAPTELIAAVDWFTISVYDSYVNELDWWWGQEAQVSMVAASTRLAVELGQGREVYGTIWHRVHDSNQSFGLHLWSDAELLSDQVNPVLANGGDGVVWWGADHGHYASGSFASVPDEFDGISNLTEATAYFRTLHMNTMLELYDAIEVTPSF